MSQTRWSGGCNMSRSCPAMETLPPEQALAIRLKYVEDMTLAQIAEHFGVQPKTIKSRIHDGTAKLRKKLKERSG